MMLPFWERIYVVYYRGGVLYIRWKWARRIQKRNKNLSIISLFSVKTYPWIKKEVQVCPWKNMCLTNMQACLVLTPMKRIGVWGGRGGIALFQSSSMEMICKVQNQRKTANRCRKWGSRGKSNNLCDWFCGYFICLWGGVRSYTTQISEGDRAMWLEELGQGSRQREKSWLLLEALASNLSKAWWKEMRDIANKDRRACNGRQPFQWQEEPSHQQRSHSPGSHRDRAPSERAANFLSRCCAWYLQTPVGIVFLQWCYSCVRYAHGLWRRGNLSRQVVLLCTLCLLDGKQIFMNPVMFWNAVNSTWIWFLWLPEMP